MPKNNEIREGKKQSIALTTSNGTTTEQTEIWKDITGYEGLYQVSNLGRVKEAVNGSIADSEVVSISETTLLDVFEHK